MISRVQIAYNSFGMALETYTNTGGIKVIERFFELPLDYAKADGKKIRVFARNLIPIDKAKTPGKEAKLPYRTSLPYLSRLDSPRSNCMQVDRVLKWGCKAAVDLQEKYDPAHYPETRANSNKFHEKGYQTLWLDQRGTGLSTPLTPDVLTDLPSDLDKAEYVKHFRADNIVNDCEAIRKILLGDQEKPEDRKWTILGQSFGGFCALNYLSFHSEGLKEVFVTGGLAPLVDDPDVVYAALIHRVAKRNSIYYKKYPQDVGRIRQIVAYLGSNDVALPNGGRLSVIRWQALGFVFGMHGGIDKIHQIVFRASNDLELFQKLSYTTLQNIQDQGPFDTNPLYAILHEPIYCQGKAPKWSASRVVKDHPQFQWAHVQGLGETEPLYFTGEMVFPEMFDDFAHLRPLKGAAEILAQDSTWGVLYDLDQLAKNEVKVSAATYYEDMYVDFDLAQDTARKVHDTEQYITNRLFHNGISANPKEVVKQLFQLSKREYD
ncbi:hypothetical protein HWV62_36420 [Athelia sp. TMB]|nr:hypothetical protein HWV62_36420 [Athelia sp. TMB]